MRWGTSVRGTLGGVHGYGVNVATFLAPRESTITPYFAIDHSLGWAADLRTPDTARNRMARRRAGSTSRPRLSGLETGKR